MSEPLETERPCTEGELTLATRPTEVRRVRRPSVNITPPERVGRIVLGLFGVVAGVVLLASASSALVIGLEVLLVLAGLDLVITGALGHCPLYKKLGHVPASLRRPT